MPSDNVKPPRYLFEPPPLGARTIMCEVEEIGRAHGLGKPRVSYRTTERGEHCVSLVFEGWRRREE